MRDTVVSLDRHSERPLNLRYAYSRSICHSNQYLPIFDRAIPCCNCPMVQVRTNCCLFAANRLARSATYVPTHAMRDSMHKKPLQLPIRHHLSTELAHDQGNPYRYPAW